MFTCLFNYVISRCGSKRLSFETAVDVNQAFVILCSLAIFVHFGLIREARKQLKPRAGRLLRDKDRNGISLK